MSRTTSLTKQRRVTLQPKLFKTLQLNIFNSKNGTHDFNIKCMLNTQENTNVSHIAKSGAHLVVLSVLTLIQLTSGKRQNTYTGDRTFPLLMLMSIYFKIEKSEIRLVIYFLEVLPEVCIQFLTCKTPSTLLASWNLVKFLILQIIYKKGNDQKFNQTNKRTIKSYNKSNKVIRK